ncbi:elongation of very long chain fatty acids protein 7 [Teleopsis dalmanni]|uniref:elongation of very long chain fatty acids protein 7 n=1 Tax=Teleopsis dalmanni TaxID=139649 RepID=UPI0018CE8B59|nr:elongation of very long chain fatty acids protein 7 [Teleopsis dalmanni]XP_037942409.1 elongation of very long chain fatty acids protein 7 [Teleopsis dalmanni]XP_037942415.1 elongation of very long chain fatty acids protein 7 [Teleopsis dalmanni]
MFGVVKYLAFLLNEVYEKHRDPRVQHFLLVGSPFPPLAIIAVYLLFVLHYGPKWMENRKPYELKNVMRIYNAIQVVANIIIFIIGIRCSALHKEYSLLCQPIDNDNTKPWMLKLLNASYCYYLTKYLDLFDTIFFVLRKKNRQITFLHVYHHAGMVFGCHIHMTFMAGSLSTMLGMVNLVIHTVMYSYYLATSLQPIKEALWWKRHITELQLLQFGFLMVLYLQAILRKSCEIPLPVSMVAFMQNLFMFALFFEFYFKTYLKKQFSSSKPKVESCAKEESSASTNSESLKTQ